MFQKDDKGNQYLAGDADLLIKFHSDIYVDSRSIPKVEDGDKELLQLFKEENENLKMKIVEISK